MSDNGLTFNSRDEYFRKPIAEKLIALLSSEIRVSPLVIDGSWGTGKTEFCHKLIALVDEGENAPFRPVYVDAFREDHADQPLMTLLAAVLSLMPEEKRVSLIRKALPVLKFSLRTAGKAAISWVLKQDCTKLEDGLDDAVKEAGESIVDKAVESMLADHMKAEESIRALKEMLTLLSEEKPIVLFVDELDRCRPDFAVAMLEVIKHIFDVDGVKFVLVTNVQQLKAAVNHSYGSDVDAQRYLDKFLGFTFRLSDRFKPLNEYETILVSKAHFENMVDNSLLLKESGVAGRGIRNSVCDLVEVQRMSLREVETFVRYMEIAQLITNGEILAKNIVYGYILLHVYAIYCQCFYPELASKLLTEGYSADEIATSLGRSCLRELDAYDHPPTPDLLLGMLIFEMPNLPDEFDIKNDAQKKTWRTYILQVFESRLNYPTTHERMIEIVQRTIKCLRMLN